MFANLLLCKHGLFNMWDCTGCFVGQTEHCIKNTKASFFVTVSCIAAFSFTTSNWTALQHCMWLLCCWATIKSPNKIGEQKTKSAHLCRKRVAVIVTSKSDTSVVTAIVGSWKHKTVYCYSTGNLQIMSNRLFLSSNCMVLLQLIHFPLLIIISLWVKTYRWQVWTEIYLNCAVDFVQTSQEHDYFLWFYIWAIQFWLKTKKASIYFLGSEVKSFYKANIYIK